MRWLARLFWMVMLSVPAAGAGFGIYELSQGYTNMSSDKQGSGHLLFANAIHTPDLVVLAAYATVMLCFFGGFAIFVVVAIWGIDEHGFQRLWKAADWKNKELVKK